MSKKLHKRPDVDSAISRTVRALLAMNDDDGERLPATLYLSRATYYQRLNGSTEWRASEVRILADYFAVPVELLYNGLGSVMPLDPSRRGGTPPDITVRPETVVTRRYSAERPITGEYAISDGAVPYPNYNHVRKQIRSQRTGRRHPAFADRGLSPFHEGRSSWGKHPYWRPTSVISRRANYARRPSRPTRRG